MKQPKILLVSHFFYPKIGGIETVAKQLADTYSSNGYEIKVLTWTKDSVHKELPYQVVGNPTIHEIINTIRWANVILEINPCMRLLWPSIFLKRRRITSLHTWLSGSFEVDIIKKKWINAAEKVIGCSQIITDKISKKKGQVIYNSYDEELFKNHGRERNTDFVFLGRVVSDKGLDLLLKSFSKMNEKATLSVIGDGEDKENMVLLAEELGIDKRVSWYGAQSGQRLVSILNRARVLVVPSRWREPFGIVALEGMACGCLPVVSSDTGLVEAVGEFGIVFRRNDELSLTKALEQALEKSSDFWNQDVVNYLSNFEREKVSEQYLVALQEYSE